MSRPVDLDVSPEGMLLTDRVAVITGAAQGIGEACAVALARFGADVAICDREAEGLAATAAAIEALGRRVVGAELDVRDADAVDAFLAAVEAEYGHVDVLVNNAGGTFFSAFLDVSSRGEDALIAENFTQVTHFIRRVVPSFSMHSAGTQQSPTRSGPTPWRKRPSGAGHLARRPAAAHTA